MTDLSNIFIGDQVVTQAYYRDAVLYKSKGWETLPTTIQDQWVKTYAGTIQGNILCLFMGIDNNNIYIISQDSTTSIICTKLDLEGNIIKQENLVSKLANSTYGSALVHFVRKTSSVGVIIVTYADTNYYKHVAFMEYAYSTASVTFVKEYKITELSSTASINDAIVGAATSKDQYIYISIEDTALKIDSNNYYSVVARCVYGSSLRCSVMKACSNGDIIFGFDQTNIPAGVYTNNLELKASLPDTGFAKTIEIDSLGYIYVCGRSIKKFSADTYELISSIDLTNLYFSVTSSSIDTQDNIIFFTHDYTGGDTIGLNKVSSDGTDIWRNRVYYLSYMSTYVLSDNNNNIYIFYRLGSNTAISISKWLNIYHA